MSTPGGWSPVEPVTAEVQEICLEVKSQIEEMIRNSSDVYTPISFAYQIVKGKNYVVKVQVGIDLCVHAMIFAALPAMEGNGLCVESSSRTPSVTLWNPSEQLTSHKSV